MNKEHKPCPELAREGFCTPACIKKWAKPQCPAKAVIPLIEVNEDYDLQKYPNHFVHVATTNRTYYVDSAGRFIITWQGDIFSNGYDAQENPLRARRQTVYDFANNKAYVYNETGEYRIINLAQPN